jgi:Uma2 family endonuclease
MGVVLSDVSAVIPDIVFMSHERRKSILEGDRIIAAPDLAIEILSPGSDNERRDRTAKRQLYGKHGVGEYWLVDPETRTIEVFSLESNRMRLAGTYSESDEISSDLLPGFSCPVQLVFSV